MRGISIAVSLLSAAPALAQTAAPDPAPAQCRSAGMDLAQGVEVIQAWRAFRGPDGASRLERVEMKGKHGSYYGGSVKLTQFDLGTPTRVVLVYGHPNIHIPPHPSPYREIFLILSGSSTMVMPDGQTIELTPGTLFIADDVGVTKGRGGSAGPCGYVALDLQYSMPPLPESQPSYDKK